MSTFRSIRPAQAPASGYSSSDPSQTTTGESSSGSSGKKRKAPSHVTANACTNCKKARAKCDGQEPEPCSRCQTRDITSTCRYEVHVKTAKEEMLRRIRGLEATNLDLREVNEDLEEENEGLRGRNQEYRLKQGRVEFIFNALRSHSDGDEIVDRLRSGHSYDEIAQWLGGSPVPQISRLSPLSDQKLSEVVKRFTEASNIESEHRQIDIRRWTFVTSELSLVRHLLALYFTWVHPVHMLFDEELFMASFDRGETTFCSPGLVNAICAMACQLLDGNVDKTAKSIGEQFVEETLKHLSTESIKLLPTIQAFSILFLVGWGAGEGAKASPYLRLAAESLGTVTTTGLPGEAVELSAWGIQTLNTSWVGFTYQKPSAPVSPHATVFKDVDLNKLDKSWRAYRQPGDNKQSGQPSLAISTAFQRAKLYCIVHETINICCGSRGKISARATLRVYQRYLIWKEELPPAIADVQKVSLMPHVCILHMEYYTAVINLFHPLLDYPEFSERVKNELKSLCLHAAQSGLQRAVQLRALYGSRHQLPIHSLCVLHLSDFILRFQPSQPNSFEVMQFCMASLKEASAGFALCAILLQMFWQTIDECGLTPSQGGEELARNRIDLPPYELLNACTRLTYAQPTQMIAARIDPTMAQNFAEEWQDLITKMYERSPSRRGPSGRGSGGIGDKYMQIDSLLNE